MATNGPNEHAQPVDEDPYADCFHPPRVSTRVFCLHCHEEYDSYQIQWRVEPMRGGKMWGHWCCPMPNCSGAGFGFDIFPLDPDYEDPDGRDVGTMADFGYYDDPDDDDDDDDDEAYLDLYEHEMFAISLTWGPHRGEQHHGWRFVPGEAYPLNHGGQSRPVRDSDHYRPIPF